MDCSMPGLPVDHQLPESTQTYAHWVGDAIQPSHPLSPPSPPTFNHSQHQGLFKWVKSNKGFNVFSYTNHLSLKVTFSSVQSLSHVWLFVTPCTAASQPSLSLSKLPELALTHIRDAIQASNPLLPLSLPAFNHSQNQGLFKWVSSSHQVAKILGFQLQHQSFQWLFRTDFL